ncbi:hypothetical protein LZ198_41590 [Myxococcus sp. K15C18031901]|uniref:hypothetical protein n=1 Tax=Myxococcus dinghuensis TaxID=2906761 RepID=UPI0020A8242D|nr:hypothetical protein [Myxococcus dinghuensis]MCP3105376.1 hypothetical protein [Myxococcus dinghuensis]
MSGPSFFQTHMGQRFYETTMPQLVRQLSRLNDNMERLVSVAERLAGTPPSSIATAETPPSGDVEGK